MDQPAGGAEHRVLHVAVFGHGFAETSLVLVRDGSTTPLERTQVDFPSSQSRPPWAPTSRAHPRLSPPRGGDVDGNLRRVTSWRQELPVSVPAGAQPLRWQAEVPAGPPLSWRGGKDTVLALKPCPSALRDKAETLQGKPPPPGFRKHKDLRLLLDATCPGQDQGNGRSCHVACSFLGSDLRHQDLRQDQPFGEILLLLAMGVHRKIKCG